MSPELFSDLANPDPLARLTHQITIRWQELDIARTVKAKAEEEAAEYRLNLLLDALSDYYRRHQNHQLQEKP